MTFEELNLNPSLYKAITDLGYTTPTTIQKRVFPVAMSGRDVCGIAQTGTGKTFAYLLPLLRQWKFSKETTPQILIMVPTRELVVQVVESVEKLTKYINLVVVGVFGGVNMAPQAEEVEQGVDVLVATPGRLLDLILNGAVKTKTIKKLVIDEVDEMLNLGFRAQLKRVMDLLPPKRQNLMFSATMIEDVEMLMEDYFDNPVKVEAAPTGTPLENIEQQVYEVPNFYTKVNLLRLLFARNENMSKVLVFVASKSLANQLYEELEAEFADVMGVIHSNKEQNHRFNTVRQFADGTYRFIIATDIIARGLDIAEVTHVINFDLPDVPEHYMHRIGRTGRKDRKGIAISFVTPKDFDRQVAIEALMKFVVPVLPEPEGLVTVDRLTDDEMPKIHMKEIQVKIPKRENVGAAFHEKSAKNQKVNFTTSRKEKMMKKYGKPKTRGQKRK
jgi:ATP-dependent RNA helicase RhlE